MAKDKNNLKDFLSLRQRAEESLNKELLNNSGPSINKSEHERNDSDLQKRNNELELQNEELRNALERNATAIASYDYSPVAYFTLKKNGILCQINQSGATMFGEDRFKMEDRNIREFISSDSLEEFNRFLERVFNTRTRQACKLQMLAKGNQSNAVYVNIESLATAGNQCLLTAVNIGEQKLAEDKVSKQIQFFEQMFSHSCVSTMILDPQGWSIKVNTKLTELFGVEAKELEGRKYNIFKDKSLIREGIIPQIERVFQEGIPAEWDICFDIGLTADAQHIKVAEKREQWVQFWLYPIFDDQGKITHVILQHTDISDRIKNEERLNASETRYRLLFESAKDGIIVMDSENGQVVDVNPYACQLLGFAHGEWIGKNPGDLGIFKNEGDFQEVFRQLEENGYLRFENIILVTKFGNPVNVELTCNIYQVEGQKVIQCNFRNISERIKAEKEIYKLRKTIEQGPSAITITNAEGKIEFVNNKFTELTQYQLIEVLGKQPRIFNQGHLTKEQYAELWETLKMGKIWEGHYLNRKKDHTFFKEETSISAVKNLDGTISNYILIQNDISEKQQIINDLIKAKERAEESDMLKTAFLANMSHEIRTPLNSIIGFSELMTDHDFDIDQLYHFAQIIHSSGNKLLSIISDIMDLSKIEAGEVKIDKRRLSVNQLIIDIQKEYLFKAIEKGIELRIDPLNPEEDVFIESDENKLRQVLINFVGNAIKFTESGYVELGIQRKDNYVQIQVKDTGIGIQDQYKEKIFERFRQVESAYTKKYGGNGLGLAISKALVELLGGHVGMETEHGKGSVFYFTVPVSE